MTLTKICAIALASAALLASCSPTDGASTQTEAPAQNDAAARIAAQSEAIAKQKAEDKAKQDALEASASTRYKGDLPFAETGQGETIDLFMDFCVERFSKDLQGAFEIAKASGYEVILERPGVAKNFQTEEEFPVLKAWTRSPATGKNPSECPIRLDIDYASSVAMCKVRLDKACAHFDRKGAFLENKLLEREHVSRNPGTIELERIAESDAATKECVAGQATTGSDRLTKRYVVDHPDSEVTSASLEYMRCNTQHVTLTAFIPWIED